MGISRKNERGNFLAAYQRVDEEERLAKTLKPLSGREKAASVLKTDWDLLRVIDTYRKN